MDNYKCYIRCTQHPELWLDPGYKISGCTSIINGRYACGMFFKKYFPKGEDYV